MIKTERIDDLKFKIRNVEEIKKPLRTKEIADILNKFPNYKLLVFGENEEVYYIDINHRTQEIILG